MTIRLFRKEDLPALLAIQKQTPQAAQWLGYDYEQLAAASGGMILVAELETEAPPGVLGFCAIQRVTDEAEIRNLAVDLSRQRQGIARLLLEDAKQRLRSAGVKRCFLEVRAANQAAQQLYYAAGFSLHSVRRNYYRDPPDDALVLYLELLPVALPQEEAVPRSGATG